MITRHLRPRGEGLFGQLVRYTLASGIALALDYGLFSWLVHLGLNLYLAHGIAAVLGALVGYWICLVWVFAGKRFEKHSLAFGAFFLIGLGGLGLSYLVLWLTHDLFAVPGRLGLEPEGMGGKLVCKGFASLASFAWNFSVRKLLLFR